MASSVEVQRLTEHEVAAEGNVQLPSDVLVYAIDGPFFFGAVENFERAIAQTHTDPRLLVIRLKRVPFMDISGIQTLEEVIGKFHKRHIQVILCEANTRVKKQLERAGIIASIGVDHYFDAFSEALSHGGG